MMETPLRSARWQALVLGSAWAAYALALVLGFPFTPLVVLAMVVPLGLTGWFARGWSVPTVVGLAHGAALAGIGIWLGTFSAWGPGFQGFALVAAILMLMSWFTALAGRTVRMVQVLRERTEELEALHFQVEGSEANVQAIVSATNVALINVGPDGRIEEWNPGAESVFGRSAAAMKGRPIDDMAAPGKQDCMGPIKYVLDTGRSIPPFTGQMPHGDGHMLDVEVRAMPVPRREGNGLVLSVADRTRVHTVEEALEEATLQFDSLVRNLDEVIYSVEVPSHKTLLLSETAAGLVGRPVSDFNNFHKFLELAHPDDAQAVARRWNHARSGERSEMRWRIRDANGDHTWVKDRVVPSRDAEGKVVRVDGIMQRIGPELELERQAQRMMRWLDGLEPLTGCGAWSLDLRSGEWQWSSGIHDILQTTPEEEEELSTWMARLGSADAARLEALVEDPEGNVRPFRLHVYTDDEPQECIVEPWIQRGADGEPIWLYGLLRPTQRVEAETRPAPRSGLAAAVEGPATPAMEGSTVTVQQQKAVVRPGSPEAVDRFLRAALSRSRQAVTATETVEDMEPEARDAMERAVQETVLECVTWAKERRTPMATGDGMHFEPVHMEVTRLADEAEQAVVHRILAQEQREAAALAAKAHAEAMQAEERVQRRVAAAKEEAQRSVDAAERRAKAEAKRAAEAEQHRKRTEAAMSQALREAKEQRDEAIARARRTRQKALQQAQEARDRAEREARQARQANEAMAEAEAARRRAAKEAEEAKQKALSEAGEARAAAMELAEAAKERAEQLAKQAEEAAKAKEEAEAAKQEALAAAKRKQEEAIQEAKAAKEQAIKDAEEAKQAAMQEAETARAAAKKEAQRAEASEAALREAKQAAEAAVVEMKAEAQQALQEAERLREAARKEAEQARAAARAEAAKAQQAEQARERAIKEAERERDRAIQEAREERRKAVAAAEAARDKALREAEAARAEAQEHAAALAAKEAEAQAAQEAQVAAQRQAEEEARELAAQEAEQRAAEEAVEEPAEEPPAEPAKQPAPARPTRPARSPWQSAADAVDEEEGAEMDVVWDDEIGWIPKPRGGKRQDKAEQIEAKEVGEKRRRGAGPWSL